MRYPCRTTGAGNRCPLFAIMRSAPHEVDVLDRDRAAVPEIDDENGKPDGGLRGRHRQNQQREHLPDQIAEEGREGDEIDVHREQDQLDRHQDDDHVLPVEEDAEDPDGEQDRRDGEVVAEPDGHDSPCPGRTFTISIASSRVRPICCETFWRLTFGLCCSVSTMAPIIATRRIRPAAWKKKM